MELAEILDSKYQILQQKKYLTWVNKFKKN